MCGYLGGSESLSSLLFELRLSLHNCNRHTIQMQSRFMGSKNDAICTGKMNHVKFFNSRLAEVKLCSSNTNDFFFLVIYPAEYSRNIESTIQHLIRQLEFMGSYG